MPDDLVIDDTGRVSADDAREHLAERPGAWKLLASAPELLLALRQGKDGLLGELRDLHPNAAVLAGDLGEMQPSDLLNFLHQGRRTGVLLTRSDGVERGIVLLDGNVAWACSTSAGERLGGLVSRMGLVDAARVEEVIREQQSKGGTAHRRIGQLFVDRGLLTADEVWRALRHQVVEIFLGLLVARAGSFVFMRGVDRSKLPAVLAMDTQALLLDGLRRLDEMELYRTRIPGLASTPRRTAKAVPAQDAEALGPDGRRVLALVDGARTLGALSMDSGLGEFEATKATYRLLLAGYLELL